MEDCTTTPPRWRHAGLGASFFFYFCIIGVLLPYLSPTLLAMGYQRSEIGVIHGCVAAFTIAVPAVVGRLTDRFSTIDRAIRLCLIASCAGAAAMWGLSGAGVGWFVAALFVFSASRAPLTGLHDGLALQMAAGDAHVYARFRVMGSLGFIAAATCGGWLIADQTQRMFPLLLATAVVALLVAHALPAQAVSSSTVHHPRAFWRSLSRNWWLWLSAMMLHWFAFGPYHYGYTLLLQEQGVDGRLAGIAWSLGVFAEVLLFLGSGAMFLRFSHRRVLFIAMGSSLLRWLLVGLCPTHTMLWLTQLLHGPGFALFYAAAMQGIDRYARGRWRASYQGLFSTAIGGLASVAGMTMAGWLHNRMPMHEVLLWMVPVQLLAMVILWRSPLLSTHS